MASKIDTKSKRDGLAIRREPYWAKVQAGGYIGFRRIANGGTWIARYRDEEGKQKYKALTLQEHIAPNVYDAAVNEARRWFAGLEVGVKPQSGSLTDAGVAYLTAIKTRKGPKAEADAKARIARCIKPQLGKKKVDRLKTVELEQWLFGLVPEGLKGDDLRKARASANRNLTTLKAILNKAHRDGVVASSVAWDRVKPFDKVDGARKAFLTKEQVRSLVNKSEGNFKHLVKSAALIGARYGELCALRARDFDKPARVLHIREGKTGERIVPLTGEMVAHFSELAKSKLPDAYLLTRDDGKPWAHSDQDALMRKAARAAKLPAGTVFYTLRHSFIASTISAGMDIYSVAEVTGTSVRMIEMHYGKLLKDRVREAMTIAAIF